MALGRSRPVLRLLLGCLGISLGNRCFPVFFVLSIAVLVPVLVLDFFHRLGSNVIFEAPESVGSRDIYRMGLGGVFRVRVPFH
jgi:hypothetical protein